MKKIVFLSMAAAVALTSCSKDETVSVAGEKGISFRAVATAAKAGVAKFSHGLYTELRPYGVRVSCVTPSWGQTGFNHAANISGASENPELAAKCIAPEELGNIIKSIIEQPDHLAIPDVTVQPVIQDISPM